MADIYRLYKKIVLGIPRMGLLIPLKMCVNNFQFSCSNEVDGQKLSSEEIHAVIWNIRKTFLLVVTAIIGYFIIRFKVCENILWFCLLYNIVWFFLNFLVRTGWSYALMGGLLCFSHRRLQMGRKMTSDRCRSQRQLDADHVIGSTSVTIILIFSPLVWKMTFHSEKSRRVIYFLFLPCMLLASLADILYTWTPILTSIGVHALYLP